MAEIPNQVLNLAGEYAVAHVAGVDGYFAVSNGSVITTTNNRHGSDPNKARFLKPCLRKNGYFYVMIAGRWWLIHRLVLIAFKGYPQNPDAHCRHLDGNPLNNDISNLTWGTRQENMMDKVQHGTTNRGERCAAHKLSVKDVLEVRKMIASGVSNAKISRQFGIDPSTVSNIKTRKNWWWL